MGNQLSEIKNNLRKVGQFDLADTLGPKSIPESEVLHALEYSRYLMAISGSRTIFAAKIRADILAALWGYTDHQDDGERLRVHIMVAIERLVRGHPDIKDIHGELLVLATAYEIASMRSYDLYKLSQLVSRADFDGLKEALYGLCPSTKSYIQVFGRAYYYHDTGDMNGIAYDKVLQEVDPRGGEPHHEPGQSRDGAVREPNSPDCSFLYSGRPTW